MKKDTISGLVNMLNLAYAHKFEFKTYEFNFEHVYRGRKFEYAKNYDLEKVKNEITHINNMWAPPPEFAAKNRCNKDGDPKLYLTTVRKAIPFELRYELGDIIVIMTYCSTQPLKPITPIGCNTLKSIDPLYAKLFKDHFSDKSIEIQEIDDTLGRFFSLPENCDMKQFEWFLKKYNLPDIINPYDLTIAISENFYLADTYGLIHPSVAHKFISANFVLQPEYFTNILKPKAIEIYDNFMLKDNGNVVARLLSIGTITDCGIISWPAYSSEKWIEWE
jgi:hypothetical protein